MTTSHQMMTYLQSLHDVEDFRYDKGLLNGLHWRRNPDHSHLALPGLTISRGAIAQTGGELLEGGTTQNGITPGEGR